MCSRAFVHVKTKQKPLKALKTGHGVRVCGEGDNIQRDTKPPKNFQCHHISELLPIYGRFTD